MTRIHTMAIWTVLYLLLVTEISAQVYDQFVLKIYRDLCPYSETCTLPPKLEFPYNRKEKIPCCLPCSCEWNCFETNSCCPDAMNSSLLHGQGRYTECLSTAHPVEDQSNDGFHSNFKRYNTIRKCPSTYLIEDTRLMCTRPSPKTLDEHIFVSDEAGNIYRNRYCALCNGVVNFTQWDLLVECFATNESLTEYLSIEILNHPRCSVWSKVPRYISLPANSRCYLPKYDKCRTNSKWKTNDSNFDKACSSGQYGAFVQKKEVFKNVFCSVCNTDFKINYVHQIECYPWVRSSPILYPITVIVNPKVLSMREDPTARCMISKIYDTYSNQCRDLICPLNSIPKYGTCVKVFKATDGLAVAFEVHLTSSMFMVRTYKDLKLIVMALNNKIEKQDGTCRVCANAMQLDTTKENLTAIAKLSLVTSPSCLETTIMDIANRLNNNTLVLKRNSTNKYTIFMNLNSKKTDWDFNGIPDAHILDYSYTKNICKVPPIHLNDLQCPRIMISGLDYINALRNNYIKPIYHYDKYIMDGEDKIVSNISFEICLDEYFSSSGGGRVGQTYGIAYNMLADGNRMTLFAAFNVFITLLLF